jgi:autotransporter-associated beta strand protein
MNIGNAATTAATGTVNQSGGAISFTSGNAVLVGQGTVGNQGVYNMSGGSITTFASTTRGIMLGVNSNLAPGPSSGGGTFNLSGTGVLNMTAASGGGGNALLQIGRSDTAANNTTNAFNQTGGTANVGILTMGGTAAGSTGVSATLNLTGGTFSANSFTLMSAGGTNTSVINIGASAAVTLPAFPTNAKGASSTATITFDSTTGSLSPLAGSATYMPAGTFNNAYLTANGAKFNVGTGNDITIGQVLEDAVSPAAAGTLTKSGLGTLTLTAANSYTGATSVSAGTLALVGGSQASPITVSAGASLSFTLGSPTTSTSSFDVTAGTIKITGTPTLPSYTLITSSTGITGTPTLDAPIAGYSLVKVGNSLVLTSPQGLYDAWVTATGGAGGKTANPDSDSLNNLLEYAFGTDPLAVTGDLVYSGGSLTTPGKPILEEVGGVWYAVFTRRKDHVDAGLTYSVEFSSDLSPWTASAVGATVVASDSLLEVVRVPFPNLVSSDSGPQKPRFFQVKVTSSF